MCTIYTVIYGLHFPICAQETRQESQCNEASRLFKRAQRCLDIKYGEVSLQYEFATLPQKPQPLYDMK